MNGQPPWDLAALVVVVAINRLAARAAREHRVAYLLVQGVDAVTIVTLLTYGLPGLDAYPAATWTVAGLFSFHMVFNAATRAQHQRALAHEAEIARLTRRG